eukprot:CAMPEP_0197185238 /NCGR_PEP_ID=MMETSP1423-20130617/11504_1 /TAXON_ID=476441 /ORGANISM="Pseudo-nitzschia heimii, Strain UNC1101" /LENGTH=364 /DNA_ID=CAMNT_0042636249 /DNA_START=66 /DNA_END=1160 /DNA_ORIENTATION=-
MKTAQLLLVPLALGVCIDTEVFAAGHGALSIFKTPAFLEIQFTKDDQFSADDIFHVEEATSLYLRELLMNDSSLRFLEEPDSLIDVSVNVQTQQVNGMNGNEISLGSEVDLIHYGDVGITDVAALLTLLVHKNNTDSSFIYLDHIIRTKSSIELMRFDYISESAVMATNLTTFSALIEVKNAKKYGNEKTLLVVTTLLSITLFGMSAILIWVGGGWLVLRKKVQDLLLREEELTRMTRNIESKPTQVTEDGDEENQDSFSRENGSSHYTNPSEILGVNSGSRPNMYGNDMKTPGKVAGGRMSVDDLATPMSVMSEYSDTDRVPIGIMSMRKLIPPPQVNDDDDNDNADDEKTAGDFNGMKKLEY